MITKKSLGIFWKFEDGFEEIDGIYFYGLWKNTLPEKLNLFEFYNLWNTGEIDLKISKFDCEEYKVFGINVYIAEFPESFYWIKNIENIFVWLIDNGSYITWCGAEDCSPNPKIFDSKLSSGNVYACYTKKTGLICNSDLNDEFKCLNDNQLDIINKIFLEK